MLTIDGSQGEGGGQLLRTSLSLSTLTGRPFRIDNIRAGRSRPGLRPQHLTAVRAAAQICQAKLDGDRLESLSLLFRPTAPAAGGEYHFDVTDASPSGLSAGSVTLIVQAILWPLLFANRPSSIALHGGTFVPFSPAYHYLSEVTRAAYASFGASFDTELVRWGWMTAGGGIMQLQVEPLDYLRPARFNTIADRSVRGIAAVTNLASHIPHRMARRAHNLLNEAGLRPSIEAVRAKGAGPGAGIVLWRPQAGFSNLGRRGLPAEEVARVAVADLLSFMDNGAAVDRYLADQLLVPMALAAGQSSFTTDRVSNHLLTCAQILRQWLDVTITVQEEAGEFSTITVDGVAYRSNSSRN